MEIMPAADRKTYQELQQPARPGRATAARGLALPAFWTVEVDPKKALEKSYILTSGDPDRPEKDHEVAARLAVRTGDDRLPRGPDRGVLRLADRAENPLFARVAVNRLWQWHFGEGLQKTPSDFGELGGTPAQSAAARLAGVGVRARATSA